MVEFDVRAWDGELVLAHTIFHARRGGNVRLTDALAHLASRHFAGIELNVDVKHDGCESVLLEALDRTGLLERALISSQVPSVLDAVRAREPRARLGISIGGRIARLSRRWEDWRAQVMEGLSAGRWQAVMVQHRLVEPGLLDQVSERRGLLYAWTVNERRAIERLRAVGVHGIATADPRLFT